MIQKIGIFIVTIVFAQYLSAQENTVWIKTKEARDTISRNIYGHFAEHLGRCIYDGVFVGIDSKIPNKNGLRLDVLEALKEIKIPVLRWPGGCFAEQYHWKDGIGPVDKRPPMVNYSWGGVVENNSFGTHEFLELCDMLGAEPYIALNIASGTVQDAAQWIEYVNSDKDTPMTRLRKQNGREKPWNVKFWGIGNENWGCGGNMTATYYTDIFKHYSTYCPAKFKVACGGNGSDTDWTRTFFKAISSGSGYFSMVQGYSYHYYSVNNWSYKGKSVDFSKSEWFATLYKAYQMKEDLEKHLAIMDELDPKNRIALIADEWGSWYEVEAGTNPGFLYQQNTLRDAVLASIDLNIFNNHCRRVKMANIAQTVNVLQAMVLTKDAQMVKTPSYYVFKMYKVHQDALLLPTEVKCANYAAGDSIMPVLTVSASKNKEGIINVTISNVDIDKPYETLFKLDDDKKYDVVSASVITAEKMNAFNDFGKPEQVNTKEFKDFKFKDKDLFVKMPSKSVVHLALKAK